MTPSPRLSVAIEQQNLILQALQDLYRQVYPKNPKRYELYATGYISELETLRHEINDQVGIHAREDNKHDLLLRLRGPDLHPDRAPISTVAAILGSLRKGLQATIEKILLGNRKGGGRKTAEVATASDLALVGLKFGSLNISLDYPPESNLWPSEERKALVEAVKLFIQAAEWAGTSDSVNRLQHPLPHGDVEATVLSYMVKLCPLSGGAFDQVAISGRAVKGRRVVLTPKSRHRFLELRKSEAPATFFSGVGTLKEIDLDAQTFELRERPDQLREEVCRFTMDMYDLAKSCLDRKIKVTGTRQKSWIVVDDIESL